MSAGVSRRQFIGTSAGLVIGLYVAPRLARAAAPPPPGAKLPEPNAFVRVADDGQVTVLLAHSEMGQGIWTSLAMLVAEELGCELSQVRVEHAPAAPAYSHPLFGMQMTGGSSSTYSELERYRQAGALARELLVAAAADEWKVDPKTLRVEKGFVVGGANRAGFGKLAARARTLPAPKQVTLKDPKEWTIIGKPQKRLDSPEKVTGKAEFGLDVKLPGMLTAVIARPPAFGAKVKAVRADKAKAVAGVKQVVQVPSGVAVIAEHFWAAKLGRDALDIDWDLGPAATLDSDKLLAEWKELARKPGAKAKGAGDVDAALASAKKTVEAEFVFPYLAHAPMEPLNCTVRIAKDAVDIYTGTQFQTLDQQIASKITGVPPEKVNIHTTFLGGGFGRRATPTSDFVSEALHVAKAAGGTAPIKVVWTREDDIRGGYYRSMWVHRLRAGLGADGLPTAWRQTIVGQSIAEGTFLAAMMVKDGVDATSVEGASDSPYVAATPNHLVDLHSPKTPIPVLWWRSVGNTHTAFVMETFIDELAAAAGQDPVAYRLKLLAKSPRHAGVLKLAAQKAGWGKPLPKGRFRGVAVHESFESFMAEVAEVSVVGGQIRVHKVVAAVDCGVCVNPLGVSAQIDSGVAFGLSAALHGELTVKNGGVVQSNFHDYPILRLHEMPVVETHIVPSTDKAGGIGEVAVPPIAPAVANAVFAATGKRLRKLPFVLALLLAGLFAPRAARAETKEQGLQAFETVKTVLQHPRCQNCHIPGDAPLQFDDGRVHALNVKRGPDGKGAPGLGCATCHGDANPPASFGARVPPGAPSWSLPPPNHKMVFIGLSSGALCKTLKDPKKNGGKDMAALTEHVAHDKLVLWGWQPGGERAPVSVTHEAFMAAWNTWVAAGAPCAAR